MLINKNTFPHHSLECFWFYILRVQRYRKNDFLYNNHIKKIKDIQPVNVKNHHYPYNEYATCKGVGGAGGKQGGVKQYGFE